MTKSHTHYSGKKHTYMRIIKQNTSCAEQGIYMKKCETKPKYPWDGEDISRHSSGWKNKKHKKQWMHNKKNHILNSYRTYWREIETNEMDKLEEEYNLSLYQT